MLPEKLIKPAKVDNSEPIHVDIYENGATYWFKFGKLHKASGPAVLHHDGSKHWIRNGKWHRDDGPAIICPDGVEFYFINNIKYSKKRYWETINAGSIL